MQQLAGKPFQAPKIIFKSRKPIDQKCLSYAHRLKDKMLKFTFLTGLASLKLTTKENLNPRKQVFLLKALVCPETENLDYFFTGKCLYKKICSVKACLKFSTFSCLLVLSMSQILPHLLWLASWYLTPDK